MERRDVKEDPCDRREIERIYCPKEEMMQVICNFYKWEVMQVIKNKECVCVCIIFNTSMIQMLWFPCRKEPT